MEYCNGGSVAEYLDMLKKTYSIEDRRSYCNTAAGLEFFYQVLKGVRFIHANNLVHLDLKPENIFICYPTTASLAAAGDKRKSDLIVQQNHYSSPDFLNPNLQNSHQHSQNSHQKSLNATSGRLLTEDFNPEAYHSVYKVGDFGNISSMTYQNNSDLEEGDTRYLAQEFLDEDYSNLDKADIFSLGVSVHQFWTQTEPPKHGQLWHDYRENRLPYGSGVLRFLFISGFRFR